MDDAQKTLQRALALDPTLPLANNTMGLPTLRKGSVDAAETHFREAIRRSPIWPRRTTISVICWPAGRRTREAAYHFEKAIATSRVRGGAPQLRSRSRPDGSYSRAVTELGSGGRAGTATA